MHKKATNPDQLNQFFSLWEQYANHVKIQNDKFGKDMGQLENQALNAEQREKLDNLKMETILPTVEK
jgi:hypothetical protein